MHTLCAATDAGYPAWCPCRGFGYTEAPRRQAREHLGAGPQTIVALFVGRLSLHAKAHLLAMYQALHKASLTLQPGQDIVLVECGSHANDAIAQAAEAAKLACPAVRVVTLNRRIATAHQTAWTGADVFCVLSDNIQETFDITPIEAVVAGLPVVVSDWDGYKDTVRAGIDGFRIPTSMPAAGMGQANVRGFQVGLWTNSDVLNAQAQLYQPEKDLAEARFDAWLNYVRLRLLNRGLGGRGLQSVLRKGGTWQESISLARVLLMMCCRWIGGADFSVLTDDGSLLR